MRPIVRTFAFVRKEIVQVVRQPGLVIGLVLGPFVILLLFGTGLREEDPAVRTIFVVPDGSQVSAEVERFAAAQSDRLTVVSVQPDEGDALDRLRAGDVAMVLAFPNDAEATIRSGRQAEVEVFHNQIDPLETQAIELFTRTGVDEINKLVLRQLVQTGQQESADVDGRLDAARSSVTALEEGLSRGDGDASSRDLRFAQGDLASLALALGPSLAVLGGVEGALGPGDSAELLDAYEGFSSGSDQLSSVRDSSSIDRQQVTQISDDLDQLDRELRTFQQIRPGVIVSPFDGVVQRLVEDGQDDIELVHFYAPAVVALLVQHLVVTFVGLSVVRERELGTNELFRAAPVTTVEILVGKYLAFLVLGGCISALLVAGLVIGLGVPMAGSWAMVVFAVFLLLLASTGLGFVLALLANTDSQAVQYAMLVLLGSIFFSGFLLSLDRFRPALVWVARVLPVTHGVVLLRDEMLRGQLVSPLSLAVLGVLAAAGFAGSWVMLRRRLYQG